MMCEFNHWYYEDDGYVVQCIHCGTFQIGFESTLLTLSHSEYAAFKRMVDANVLNLKPACEAHRKSIVLPTPSYHVHLMLSENELLSLHNMLELTDTAMQTVAMLKLFYP
ncbi:hypothetical protein LX64_01699 [Chitinophaga skermanii]|uniref:Uncharacterized protein n=2 Tax=Chitinophaga skermanii TaxID=331697 RepID=A0A327QSA3_9BACT|nr:hypothetical protein LX64_01699 [Chitinophaga skermanii]